MLYEKYILKAQELTIDKLDNGVWYLEPRWKETLIRNNLDGLEEIDDYWIDDWKDVEDVLKLEVVRRNARDSKTNEVMNWLYDVISTTVEPAMLQEETDYIKNLVEYLKVNHDLQDKEKEE